MQSGLIIMINSKICKLKEYKNLASISVMVIITILTQFLSLSRTSLVASIFGTSIEMDAYNFSLSIITFLFGFFSAGITTIIIPYYIKDTTTKTVDTFITFIFLLIALISLILVCGRVSIIRIISNRTSNFVEISSNALLILLIGQLFSLFSGVTVSYFQCQNKYNIPKISAFVIQILIIIFLFKLRKVSIYQYAAIVSVCLVIEFVLDTSIAYFYGWRFKPNFNFGSKRFLAVFQMFLPTVFSTGIYQLSLFIDSSIASRLGVGKITILNYSNQIVSIINTAIIGYLLIYIYPRIVKQIKMNGNQNIFWKNVCFFHLIVCLLACGFVSVGYEGISLLFQHGNFGETATRDVFWGSLLYIVGQQSNVIRDLIYRYFYAKGNTKDPAKNGVVISIVNILISLLLVRYIGFYGIIIGTVIASFVSLIIILYKFKIKIGFTIKIQEVMFTFLRNIFISITTISIVVLTKSMLIINNRQLSIIVFGTETMIVFIILVCFFSKDLLKSVKNI